MMKTWSKILKKSLNPNYHKIATRLPRCGYEKPLKRYLLTPLLYFINRDLTVVFYILISTTRIFHLKHLLHYLTSENRIEVKIEDNKLIITIELQKPTPSASGKTLVVATTHGNTQTDCIIEGKPVIIGLNAYIKK